MMDFIHVHAEFISILILLALTSAVGSSLGEGLLQSHYRVRYLRRTQTMHGRTPKPLSNSLRLLYTALITLILLVPCIASYTFLYATYQHLPEVLLLVATLFVTIFLGILIRIPTYYRKHKKLNELPKFEQPLRQ